ncbi:MAG: response regulator [Phycisphaerae bacterium]|nr:response regulator [Phycisphaerae bacterium]
MDPTQGNGAEEAAGDPRARILVIDDEPEVCDVLAETLVLSGNDWEIIREVDPTRALERMRDEPFDCVITDIVMPSMSGLELARSVREMSDDIPLIAITGKANLSSSIEALRLGFHDFLQKPFDLDEVRSSVARSLTRHRRRRQLGDKLAEVVQQNAILKASEAQLKEKLDLASHDLVLSSKRLARQVRELGHAADVARTLSGIVDLNDLLAVCAELLADAVACRGATVALYEAGEAVVPVVGRAFKEADQPPLVHWLKEPMNDGVLCRVAHSCEPANVDDVAASAVLADTERWLWKQGRVLVMPVMHQDLCVGVVAVARDTEERNFGSVDAHTLRKLAETIAPSIVAVRTHYIQRIQVCSAIETLVDRLERRDYGFLGHGHRVSMYATMLAEVMELPKAEIGVLQIASRLHDIGRFDVSEAILNKNGPLSAQEMAILQTHPDIGRRILMPLDFLGRVADVIRAHHEWVDGTGYPKGLNGPDIPFLARILAVADALDAITSPRPYREARGLADAIDEIKSASNSQFDDRVVQALERLPHEQLEPIILIRRDRELE